MRVLAYYMSELGDDSMKLVLADPDTDLHRESAKGIFRIEREVTDAERQLGKNLNFSMVYQGGLPAVKRYLAEFNAQGGNVPVTWAYAKGVLKNFHARWPGVQRVSNALDEVYQRRGYLMTVAGARLHPAPTKNSTKPPCLSAVIQSSAAEVMRRALRVCHQNMQTWDSHLVTVVHDELVFDVAGAELDELVKSVPLWMDYPIISKVLPVSVSLEYSDTNWAEKKGLNG